MIILPLLLLIFSGIMFIYNMIYGIRDGRIAHLTMTRSDPKYFARALGYYALILFSLVMFLSNFHK